MDSQTLQQLFQNLNSRNAELRQEARRQVRALSSEDLCQLTALFQRHTRQRTYHMLALMLGTSILLMFLSLGLALNPKVTGAAGWVAMASLYVPVIMGFWPYRRRNMLLPILEEIENPSFIGPACLMLGHHIGDDR